LIAVNLVAMALNNIKRFRREGKKQRVLKFSLQLEQESKTMTTGRAKLDTMRKATEIQLKQLADA
jgi:hypothetical protein